MHRPTNHSWIVLSFCILVYLDPGFHSSLQLLAQGKRMMMPGVRDDHFRSVLDLRSNIIQRMGAPVLCRDRVCWRADWVSTHILYSLFLSEAVSHRALFNHINTVITVWRLKHVNRKPWRRFAEVMVVAFVVALFQIGFPYIANDCREIANPLNSKLPVPLDLTNRKACYNSDCECEPELRGALIQQCTKKWNYDCLLGASPTPTPDPAPELSP